MIRIFTLLVALFISLSSSSKGNNDTLTLPAPTKQLTDIKVETSVDGENKVIQQYVLPRFRKNWWFQRYRSWVIDNIVYPEGCIREGVEGRVVVVFMIDADGVVRSAEAVQSPDDRLSAELVRVVKSEAWHRSARSWNEESKSYESVPMRSMIAITFNLPAEPKTNNDHLTYEMMQGDFVGL